LGRLQAKLKAHGAFEFNGQLWDRLHSDARLAATYPRESASWPRVNGKGGIKAPLDLAGWRLRVDGLGESCEHTLDDIKLLPRTEITTQLKCVEGWSTIVTWAGARLAETLDYVGATTPDGGYYVGLDIQGALHPQTLLCYEMNGQPLSSDHGAPLRLVLPSKYGFKSLKRLGTLTFTDRGTAQGFLGGAGL